MSDKIANTQDRPEEKPLTEQERREAEGLVDLADTLTYLGFKARAAA